MTTRKPEIVVGIDVGQTCSGVAYSIGPDWSEPRTLNKWPGFHGIERADKVATRVGYARAPEGFQGELKNWGFGTVFGDDSISIREQFKLTLDAEYEDDRGFSCHNAREWYFDYLKCLHREIEIFFDTAVPRWRDMHVEYSFSIPTTWKNPAMIASIEKLIRSAGFTKTPLQTMRMSLTEAEAAAIEASTTQYRVGDIFLICDAGGGTTDVNVLKVKSTEGHIELEPLDHVEGVPIGSTLIDFRMAEHIVKRLELIKDHLDPDHLKADPFALAEEMLIGLFQTVKHSFPNPVVDTFKLDVKGLAGTHTFPEAGIEKSKMIIDRQVLTEIFDQQIEQIFYLIDHRLQALQAEFPNEQVSYIILSGGLGSSPYLLDEIKRRYEMNFGFRSANTASIRIMKVLEPQLAVVRGLVRERTQQLGISTSPGQEVFGTRRCRNSYGIIVREPYSEDKHQGLPTIRNPISGVQYVDDIIDWFIKQGQEVCVDQGISRSYSATIAYKEAVLQRQGRVVMSALPADQLPQRITTNACREVVVVSYRLTRADMKLKNRQLWKLQKKYWRADFSFVVKPGPADLQFQIVGKDGVLSDSHTSLTIEFLDPVMSTPPMTSPKPQRLFSGTTVPSPQDSVA